jgi:hypothetical protein
MKKTAITILAAAITLAPALAGTPSKSFKEVVPAPPPCKFRDQEIQFDVAFAGAFYNAGRPGFGGAVGVNWFFSRYLGVGIEQGILGRETIDDSRSYAEWTTIGNFFLRYPICDLGLAPYAMVGGGAAYGTGSGHGLGHVGGGIEYRATDNIGVFSDCRYVYSSEHPRHAALYRAGLRVAF